MAKLKVKVSHPGTTNIKRFFKDLDEETLLKVFRPFVREIAETAAEEVRTRIERQTFRHPPLSPKYLAWKIRMRYDPRILIRTGRYIQNIGVQEIKYPRGYGFRICLPEGVKEENGLLLTDLSRILEYGTSRIPPRPHFRPVWVEMQTKLTELRNAGVRHYVKALKKWMAGRR